MAQVHNKLFFYYIPLTRRGMEHDIALCGIHRFQDALDGIEARLEPHVIAVSGMQYSSEPGYRSEPVTGQPRNRTSNTVVGLLLEELQNVRWRE
jgi:hypothetical protein